MRRDAAQEAVETLKRKKLRLATAESCTGGLVAKLVTDVSGSSEVFEGGVVSYSNDVKMSALGVSGETLAAHGAVSEETAREMARGVMEKLSSDLAVSTTGIAGPTGGSPAKPVGTVCFGVASSYGVHSETVRFGKDLSRDDVRRFAARHALELVIEECGKYGE